MTILSCSETPKFDPAAIEDAGARISHVEPLSWWTGMRTPLQLLIHGDSIAACDVRVEGPQGLRIAGVHKADSPHYLFVDVEVAADARPGTRYFVFSRGSECFKVPYEIAARREGSAGRQSFTTADMIYLLMPDRFADGDPSIDSTPDTAEKADRSAFFGRHGGDLQGMIDHLDYIADLGATAVWS
ncbi:MAG: cyclomaltodextrinase N-terminal domain-containing protein, partial [Alistipes sp.]|nr:cyclomaltodextrinase N-terminal domain-containing protein [Alistipes sp.]